MRMIVVLSEAIAESLVSLSVKLGRREEGAIFTLDAREFLRPFQLIRGFLLYLQVRLIEARRGGGVARYVALEEELLE